MGYYYISPDMYSTYSCPVLGVLVHLSNLCVMYFIQIAFQDIFFIVFEDTVLEFNIVISSHNYVLYVNNLVMYIDYLIRILSVLTSVLYVFYCIWGKYVL